MELFNGDCLEKMKDIKDDSVDLIFNDLPYGQTSCKWDCKIDLELFWKEIMRIKKLNTPIFFTCTTKFGAELINSAPKKCPFRYDIVWVKSAPSGFLCAKKMPMRKHEMLYVFYEKLPYYDLSSHQHKFKKDETKTTEPSYYMKDEKTIYNGGKSMGVFNKGGTAYDPPLPVSVVKEEGCYGKKVPNSEAKYGQKCAQQYDPPLPVSVVKEEEYNNGNRKGGFGGEPKGLGTVYQDPLLISSQDVHKKNGLKSIGYDPPLPVSVVKEETQIKDGAVNENYEGLYGGLKTPDYVSNNIERNELRRKYKKEGKSESAYDPPLPVSVVKEEEKEYDTNEGATMINGTLGGAYDSRWQKGHQGNSYDPPLPNSLLEIKSTRGKHSTEKPIALMSWILKYYSKKDDVVLDATMGSGSTGIACKNMNRKFIGIEKDKEIFDGAVKRINDLPEVLTD